MKPQPWPATWHLLKRGFANRELGVASSFLGLAVLLGLVGLGFFVEYSIDSRTTGNLWWKETVAIPVEDRVRYLRIAMFLWALALLSLVAAGSMFVQYRQGAAAREAAQRAARDEYAKQEAHRRWLATPSGYAHSMYEAGYSEIRLTLRVEPPEHLDTIQQVEQTGWDLAERLYHPRVKTTEVTPTHDGGHEVTRTSTRDATFLFVRKRPNRP